MCGNYLSKVLGWVLIIAFFLAATPVYSQETVTLDEVVVTATKTRERNFDVPTPVETITPEYLEINNPQSLSKPIQSMPGVDIANRGDWEAYPIIRGLGANRVLVLYDGDRETNIWAGRDPLTPFLDVGDVERIEVVKGPASVLYGTDALGGVVNIITKQPNYAHLKKFTTKNTFGGSYSSVNDGYYGNYTLEGGGKGFDFRFNLSGRDTDDYDDGNGDKVHNSFLKDYRIDLKARYFINDKHEILFNYRRNGIDDMGVPQRVTAKESHFTKYNSNVYKFKYNGYNLGFFREVNLSTWYIDQQRNYEGFFYSSRKPVHTLKTNDIDSYALGATLQGQLNIKNHKPIIGIDFVHENNESNEHQIFQKNKGDVNIKERTFKPLSDADRDHFGVYLQDEFTIAKKLKVLAGVRYDYFVADADDSPFRTMIYDPKGKHIIKDTVVVQRFGRETNDAFTYNLGLLYKLTKSIHLTANASSGFRAPDVFERFSCRGGSFIIIGEPNLDPEYSYNFDGGAKFKFGKVRGTFNVFYNRVNDFIDFVKTGETFAGLPEYKYMNVADAELYGYDGSLEVNVFKQLTVFGNIAYVVGKDRDSHERLNLIPPLNGLLGIRYKDTYKEKAKYWIELNGVFYDRQNHPGPAEEETAGYAVFNFRSGIKFNCWKLKDITLNFNVDNLFDKTYQRHLNLSTLSSRINEPGRSFNLGLRVSF